MGTIIFAAGPVSQWTALQTVCHTGSACSFQLDASAARTLEQHGIALTAYAVYTVSVLAIAWALWYGLAALIVWRKPHERGALLAAFFLVVFPLAYATALEPASGPWGALWFVTIPAFPLFGLLFPDGRFMPRWTRWLAGYCILSTMLTAVVVIPFLVALLAVVAVQVYRFRSISTWNERQQTKWALFGLLVGILGLAVFFALALFLPALTANGSLYSAFTISEIPIITSAIPLSIAIAVLRGRLWDIDRVINRALVYTVLSLTLAGIYIGGVIGLEALFRLVIGNGTTLAIALPTLAVAALFGPLRGRIQGGIDRRFYRSKYDAERILRSFSEQLRDEVDPARLSQELISTVRDALHPEHVSLWLRRE